MLEGSRRRTANRRGFFLSKFKNVPREESGLALFFCYMMMFFSNSFSGNAAFTHAGSITGIFSTGSLFFPRPLFFL